MNPEIKARVVRFLNDEQLSDAVRTILEDTFLKARGNDVYFLAASKLAVDFLREGWKEMEKCRIPDSEAVDKSQFAL